MSAPATDSPAADAAADDRFHEVLEQLLQVLARLLMARSVGFPEAEAMLARAYVDAAMRWHVRDERPTASRLYMLTGIHRKKIAPLLEPRSRSSSAPSLSQLVRDRLSGDPRLLDRRGNLKPLALARKDGGELSFEAVVESVSKDIRPRAVLDQWLASGMARLDERGRLCMDLRSEKVGYAEDAKAELVDRVVRPALSAVVASLLQTRERSSTMALHVDELHPDDAHALQMEWRERLRGELMRFNGHAERRAAEAHRAGRRGPCTLMLGSFEWVDGAPLVPESEATAEPAPPPRARAPRKAPAARKTARRRAG